MTFWILYLAIDGQFNIDYPYHFAFRETCNVVGEKMVKDYKYEKYRCVKQVYEE